MVAAAARAASFNFTKIADTDTLVPGGTGTFSEFEGPPVISGSNVAFPGSDSLTFDGLYLHDGGTLSAVADRTTAIPGEPTLNFTSFDNDLSIDGSTVAFEAFANNLASPLPAVENMILTFQGGSLTIRAFEDRTLVPPANSVPFSDVDDPMIRAGAIGFLGNDDASDEGIFLETGGTIMRIMDHSSPVPGLATYNFSSFDTNTSFDGTTLAGESDIVDGTNTDEIVFTVLPGGGVISVAQTVSTLIPGKLSEIFDDLAEPSIDQGTVAFGGSDASGNEGIYTDEGGSLRLVADENTTVPGRSEPFTGFDTNDTAIDDGRIVFEGDFLTGNGLFFEREGTLSKLIDSDDILDGKNVSSFDLAFNGAISGDLIAFRAFFTDGSEGIFVGQIPEPRTVGVFIMSVVGVAALSRRRGKQKAPLGPT